LSDALVVDSFLCWDGLSRAGLVLPSIVVEYMLHTSLDGACIYSFEVLDGVARTCIASMAMCM
jgi:hypothetical protein